MNEIFEFRRLCARMLIVYLWAHVPVAVGAAVVIGGNWLTALIFSAAASAVASLAWWRRGADASARQIMAVSLMAMPATLILVFAGHPWQIDLHMYFFAALALLAAFYDRWVIIAAAGAVAVHHLTLNFLAPQLVFPDGTDLLRVVLHAVVVVIESGFLIWLSDRFVRSATQRDALETEAADSREAADAERAAMAGRVEEQRRAARLDLANRLEAQVAEMVDSLGQSSAQLEESARRLTGLAEQSQERSDAATEAAGETSKDVDSVAVAAEQMAGSIREISENVGQSADIAKRAVSQTLETENTVKELTKTATDINEIVTLISEIAEQTNLLALNATIEAARAGEAGKGFAVVANEVKSLATQTAKATSDITGHIDAVQRNTEATASAMTSIRDTIAELEQVSAAVSVAVEEQDASTAGISRATQEAADRTRQVSTHIGDVRGVAGETGSAAKAMLDSVAQVSTKADHLRSEMEKLIAEIRAA